MSSPTDDVQRLRQATGLGGSETRDLLAWQPALCERILRAAETQGQPPWRDPAEDDPATAPLVAEAHRRAEAEVDSTVQAGPFRGRSQAVWKAVARILRDEHGLEWFSPGQLNPASTFD